MGNQEYYIMRKFKMFLGSDVYPTREIINSYRILTGKQLGKGLFVILRRW
jgi:hypothetical protein